MAATVTSSSRPRSNSCTPRRFFTTTWSMKASCGASSRLGKNIGDDFREGKITLPVVLAFRRGSDAEREFWRRTLEHSEATDADLDHAIGLMIKHRALEDTIGRAHHYGAIARDALALFPDSRMKAALAETVDFCIARTH